LLLINKNMDLYFAGLVAILGLMIGSFLNCLIWRIYKGETVSGRSYCPKCRKQIAWYDNIPLLSFIFLKGRCRFCQKNISWQYPLVELATAVLFLLVWNMHSYLATQLSLEATWPLLRDLIIVIFAIVVFVYDYRWQLVPLNFVWIMSVLVAVLNIITGQAWTAVLFYGVIGGAFFLTQYILTKKQGVGEGDIWLGIFLGLAFPNWAQLLVILIFSYGIGSIVSLLLLASRKKSWKSAIALGSFLALGAIIALLYGPLLIPWYLGLTY